MTAAEATDFFLSLCERADNGITVAVDALALGETLGIHAPTVFGHVNALKACGWIEELPSHGWGGLPVRLTEVGVSRSASERRRRAGMPGRHAAEGD